MLDIRRANQRGRGQHGWLDSHHTFSFADYYDPSAMGFRSLRVINDDRVDAGAGFPTHPHRDMEIISYVVEGALEHRDSMGNGSVIRPGEVQRMSAGTGVTHSEFNPSRQDALRFLQIWIRPDRQGIEPGYEQRDFPQQERSGRLRVVVSPDGRDGSLRVNQDAVMLAGHLDTGDEVTYTLPPDRHAWLQVVRGRLEFNGETLEEGDGVAISDVDELQLATHDRSAEVILFDLA